MDTPRPVQPVGLIGLPRLANALNAAGLTVVGGGESLRSAVPAIRDARATYGYFPVLAADSAETGLGSWLNSAANSGAQVVIAFIDGESPVVNVPAAKRVALPCLLADLISATGYPTEGLPVALREAFVDHDGHVEWNDPAAPQPTFRATPPTEPAFRADVHDPAPSYAPPAPPWETDKAAIVEHPVVSPPPVAPVNPAPRPYDAPRPDGYRPPSPVAPAPPTPTREAPVEQQQPQYRYPQAEASEPTYQAPPAPQRQAAPQTQQQAQRSHLGPTVGAAAGVYGQRPEQALDEQDMFDTTPRGGQHGCDVAVVWSGKGGVGKALTLDTRIPTPTGWTLMGEIEVGDEILGRDGLATRVEATYDHDDLELFDVHLSDGQVIRACSDHNWLVAGYYNRLNADHPKRHRAAAAWDLAQERAEVIEAHAATFNGNHTSTSDSLRATVCDLLGENIWETHTAVHYLLGQYGCPQERNGRFITYPTAVALKTLADALRARVGDKRPQPGIAPERVMTTAEMIEAGVKVHPGGKATTNFAIRLSEALGLPEADLPIDPYLLGYWLGDGTSDNAAITVGEDDLDYALGIALDHCPQAYVARFDGRTPAIRFPGSMTDGGPSLASRLKTLGVKGNKHIPGEYLRASKSQRLALLQGLMDTDGTIAEDGGVELALTDERLSRDALELIRTLGIKATMRSSDSAITENDPGHIGLKRRRVTGTRWRITFTSTVQVFRLPRKAERIRETVRKTQDWLYITDITPAPRGPGRCLTVDNPEHVFLAGQFVPTHNTTLAASIAQRAAATGRKVILVDANYGQGGQRIIIGLPKDHRSIYDVAVDAHHTGRARIKSGLLNPSQIRDLRGDQPKDVKYALLAAPPPQHADLTVVTPHLYLEMVEQARQMAHLVVIDTQIVEADTADPMVAEFLTPLLRNGDTWQVALSDESREGIANLFEILSRFQDVGVRSNRCLSLFNRVPRAAQFNEQAIERALSTYGTHIGSVGMDNTIHRTMNAGQPVADNPTITPILDAILNRITGDPAFDGHLTYTPPSAQTPAGKTPWWKKFGGSK